MLNLAARRLRKAGRVSVAAIIVAATSLQAFAAGSNTTTPALPSGQPAPVQTTNPQALLIGDATCAQQLNQIGIIAQGVAVGGDIAGLGAEIVAQAAGTGPTEQAAEAAAIGLQVYAKTASAVAYAAQIQASTLPSCDQEFTGTVKVDAGGINVTGKSIFNSDGSGQPAVAVNGNVAVSGVVTASQVKATQGISADNGAIWLGDPNGVTYSSGITLGGGALSGAGTGGPQAFTGTVSSIAIGNGASAFAVNTTALGTGAVAGNPAGGGAGATAIGSNANASFANSAAFGSEAIATRPNQQMFGTRSNTYTMPGITSPASRASQIGLLQLPTTDAAGNLASDGGETFKAIAKLRAGVALSLAATPAVLMHGEKFGVRVGWGTFNGANALGFSATGVLAENLVSKHDRLTLDGGVGFGFGEFMSYRENAVVGGRAGLQLTW
jgi:trimeric autotransporter adhesin